MAMRDAVVILFHNEAYQKHDTMTLRSVGLR